MKEYNVKEVHVAMVFGGVPFNIKCRHEDGVEDDPSGEASSQTIGSCGQIVYNKLPDESTQVTINLLYGSTEDKQMEVAYAIWKTAKMGEYAINMSVTDENIGETVLYSNMSFSKRKKHTWKNESGTEAQSWEFKAEKKTVIPATLI